MDKHRQHQGRARQTVQEIERAYRDVSAARHNLQSLIEHAETVDEGWVELVADVEAVEYRLRCALGSFEGVFQRPPGSSTDPTTGSVVLESLRYV